ncbi:MAG: hypothetical protein HPY74_07030 [Firmicutes bacterium]|nr:hypothetical protein [Bacillota bacterium]
MSNIKWLELTFIQLTPIHIGKYNYGVISESRIFIPGYTMWGALVNAYSLKNGATEEVYNDAEKKFEYISCFYPVFDNNIFLPEFCKGKLYYIDHANEKRYTEAELRAKLTDTYISTAIMPITRTSKDESLHEIEVILNKSKDNKDNVKNLNWKGVIGLSDVSYEKFLHEGLEIFVGGDVRYGLGRLRLESKKDIGENELEMWQINKDGYFRNIDNSIVNYIDVCGVDLLKGRIEAFIQLEYTTAIPQKIKNKDEDGFNLCFVPGSIVALRDDKRLKLKRGVFKREL